jgi:glutamine---fructose-6-phosphate transaminase (isomerizing)
MCGIVGYIGTRNAGPILIEGLKRLEYRGYDSAGIAVLNEGHIDIQKAVGKLKALEAVLEGRMPEGIILSDIPDGQHTAVHRTKTPTLIPIARDG